MVKQGVNTTISAGVNQAVYGGEIGENFRNAYKNAVIDFAAEKSANLIGTNYDAGNLDYATHKGLHAALGCAAGSAKAAGGNNADQGCISGAYGGTFAAVVAPHIADQFKN